MKIVEHDTPTKMTLRQLIDQDHLANAHDTKMIFEFQGSFYAKMSKRDSKHASIRVDNGFIPCFNLRSRTIRGIRYNDLVTPVSAELILKQL